MDVFTANSCLDTNEMNLAVCHDCLYFPASRNCETARLKMAERVGLNPSEEA